MGEDTIVDTSDKWELQMWLTGMREISAAIAENSQER